MVGVVLGLWLLLWPLFVISQRRFDRADAMDPGPIELPPRDPAEMTPTGAGRLGGRRS